MIEIVAHRGWSSHYPENSEPAIKRAIEAGCRWIECDVQLSRDSVPMVFHDGSLSRTTDYEGEIFDYSARELETMILRKPEGSDDSSLAYIPRLTNVLSLVRSNPGVTILVEIKDESLQRFGMGNCMEILLTEVEQAGDQAVIIAYDNVALAWARRQAGLRIGWILARLDRASLEQAEALKPEFLICNYKKLESMEPWPGPWQWMVYEINDHETARRFASRGITFIEASDIGRMIADCA